MSTVNLDRLSPTSRPPVRRQCHHRPKSIFARRRHYFICPVTSSRKLRELWPRVTLAPGRIFRLLRESESATCSGGQSQWYIFRVAKQPLIFLLMLKRSIIKNKKGKIDRTAPCFANECNSHAVKTSHSLVLHFYIHTVSYFLFFLFAEYENLHVENYTGADFSAQLFCNSILNIEFQLT